MAGEQTTFLFYDIETSGLNKCFDQVLQFAAIRTDTDLNELERHEILVKLNPDVIPSPSAVITHGLSPQMCQQGMDEISAIRTIHQLLNTPGTISIGYNTLEFDDEFLRFSFYRNLLTPYTHQYANQCGRMDLYPMAIMYFLFNKEVISWPLLENKPTMKLEFINQINQFCAGTAHNAMVDVEVTLALARKLIQQRTMWDYLQGYFNKSVDQTRITKLKPLQANSEYKLAILINGQCGANALYHCPVLYLGKHKHYNNQTHWLRLDKPELRHSTEENFLETAWVFRKKLGEPGLPLPTEPRFMQFITAERQAIIEENKQWLINNEKILQAIADYHTSYIYPKIENLDCEAALYDGGFMSNEDINLCRLFHQAAPEHKANIISRTTNPLLKKLAIRLMGKHYYDYLPEEMREDYLNYLAAVCSDSAENALYDYRGRKRITPQSALLEIKELRNLNTLTSEQVKLLNDLEVYIHQQFNLSKIALMDTNS